MKLPYTDVTGPRFANAEQTLIDCMVTFPTVSGAPLPFTAGPVDPGIEHGPEIFARCMAGEFGPIAPWEEIQPVDLAPLLAPPAPIAKQRARRKPAPAPIAKQRARRKPEPVPPAKKRKPPAAVKPPKRKR